MQLTKREKTAVLSEIVIGALAFWGLALSIRRHSVSTFRYYTTDSNVLAGVAALLALVDRALHGGRLSKRGRKALYFAACTVAVTFLVVVFILTPLSMGGDGYFRMLFYMLTEQELLFHHFLVPVIAVAGSMFLETPIGEGTRPARTALIPTAVYAAVTVTLNVLKKLDGPYPFLRVYDQPLYMSFVWTAVIFSIAYGVARLVLAGQNRRAV